MPSRCRCASASLFDHGSATSQSRYVRTIECSIDASGMPSRRRSSFDACFSTSSGIFASAIAWRSSSSSLCVSSSPSSFLIVFSCSRSTYSRCRSSSLPCVCSPISRDSFSTSTRCVRNSMTRSSRSRTLSASRIVCFSAGLMSMSPATMSASAPGDSMFCNAGASSGGTCGSSSMASMAFCFSKAARASTLASVVTWSGIKSKRAARNGSPLR